MTETNDQGLVPAVPLPVTTPVKPTEEIVGGKIEPKRDELGRILPGSPPLNPEGVGGFQERPEDGGAGRPKKQESFTWWINQFKNMSEADLLTWEERFPAKERTVAAALAYARVVAARNSLKDFREIADRSEGKAPQTIIFDGGFFSEKQILIKEVSSDFEPESEAETSTETA